MTTYAASGPALQIVPLGGLGEVGLNAMLLVDGEDALLIDCGALLGVENAPGVERAVPGFEPLFVPGRRLAGVVLTHGHEDHLGALPALLGEIDVPVFGTPLTLALARSRLEGEGRPVPPEARRQAKGRLLEVPLGGRFTAGPFEVELIRVTHSLPDSAALHITCRAGRVLHSGDFKLDPRPLDGLPTDSARLKALGEQGVDLLLSDSTNAERAGCSGSEHEVALAIERLVGETAGRVVVTLVASHFHRLKAIAQAALQHGRRLALVGRAVQQSWNLGVAQGLLPADPALLITPERLGMVPRQRVLVVASGAQGEWQGGLYRIAQGRDHALRCVPGDRVILSARTIPGNERAVRRMVNQLLRQGVEVVHDKMAPVHCSGHATAAEQAELLRWVRPKSFVPIHGERAMLEAHARTARDCGIPPDRVLVVEDGQPVVLADGALARGPEVPVSRRAVDGAGRVLDWGDVRDRNRIGRAGLLVCSAALDGRGRLLGAPAVTFRGLPDDRALASRVSRAVSEAVAGGTRVGREVLERTLKAAIRAELGGRERATPEITLHLLQVESAAIGSADATSDAY